jgi:hypothetical protein
MELALPEEVAGGVLIPEPTTAVLVGVAPPPLMGIFPLYEIAAVGLNITKMVVGLSVGAV